ncbi:MAG: hypothetical protein D4R80_02470 [Deltaproteobacteria bacterium]|nr:MAG: hypothetical protein D4R80_02470 [Deltaproteobacteria bacterium]
MSPATMIPRFDLRRLFGLPLLSAGETPGTGAPPPLDSELLFDLTGENPENRLFGRYDPAELRDRLVASGLLDGLSERGYPDPVLRLSCADPSDQRICLYAGEVARGRLLLEVRLQLAPFHPRRPIGPFTEASSFRMLVIHWLVLSSPDGTFTVDRPRLPGQEKPGLGLLNQTIALLKAFSRELSVDGVLDVPDHFHTALFYSRAFRYLDPEAEGRFLAIARDLSGVPLTLASDAIREGCLVDRTDGASFPWPPAEQVLALRGPLRRFLRSPSYREARNRALADHRFIVNWDLYREKIARRERP